MNGLASNHSQDGSRRRMHLYAVACQRRAIETANWSEIEKTLLINVANEEANLIAMRGQHHARLFIGMECGDDIAVYIGAHLVGIVLNLCADNLLQRLFEARRAGAVDQAAQERDA